MFPCYARFRSVRKFVRAGLRGRAEEEYLRTQRAYFPARCDKALDVILTLGLESFPLGFELVDEVIFRPIDDFQIPELEFERLHRIRVGGARYWAFRSVRSVSRRRWMHRAPHSPRL